MINYIENNPIKSILLLCFALFCTHLSILPVNIMEARNFVAAREMLQNNHWILTTMNDFPRYEKPPLPTWLTAFSAAIFGIKSLFAMRLPAAMAGTLLIVCLYKVCVLLTDNKKLGIYSAFITATSFYILFSGRNGQWDIFTHAFMLLSIYFSLLVVKFSAKRWINALVAGLAFGASLLSKGPVSLYALWLPFLIAYGVAYRKELSKQIIAPLVLMLVVGLATGLSWFLYVRMADPDTFVRIASEEANNWHSYNVRPFYYYWSFVVQSGLWTIPSFVALLYPYLKNRVSNKKAYYFSFLWTICSVILLSVIPEKKARYLLPVLIPMGMNTAFYVEYLIKKFASTSLGERIPVYFNFSLISLIAIAYPFGVYFYFKDSLQGVYFWFGISAVVIFACGLRMFYCLFKKDMKRLFYVSIAFMVAVVVLAFPLADSMKINPNYNNIAGVKTKLTLYSLGEPAPEMIWHLGHSAPEIKHGNELSLPAEERFGLLVSQGQEDYMVEKLSPMYRISYQQRFDINTGARTRDRLVSQFYVLEKK